MCCACDSGDWLAAVDVVIVVVISCACQDTDLDVRGYCSD